jgi:phosphinothricin acetyltransferase
MEINIQAMTALDWPEVRRIYSEGIATGDATFETDAPAWEEWDCAHLESCRLVARNGQTVLGWAALSPVSRRRVYAGVAEVSIYIANHARGRGCGKALLERLIAESEKAGLWTLQAGIFPENTASIHLHQSCGFRKIGHRERIGNLGGRWRDTVQFERRSRLVGT